MSATVSTMWSRWSMVSMSLPWRSPSSLGPGIASLPVIGLVAVRHELADRPLGERCKIVRHLDDDAAQLEADCPAFGNRVDAMNRAQQISRNGACRIAVAVVIDGEAEPRFEIRRGQRACESDRERLVGHPPFAELGQRFAPRNPARGERLGARDRRESLRVAGVTSEKRFDAGD